MSLHRLIGIVRMLELNRERGRKRGGREREREREIGRLISQMCLSVLRNQTGAYPSI